MHQVTRPRVLVLCLVLAALVATLLIGLGSPAAAASDYEIQVFNLINQQRAAQGLAPFAWQDNLATAAHAHSVDMATHSLCSHTGSDGSDPGTRIAQAGYQAPGWGETVAGGQSSPAQVVNAWMTSPGHRDSLMGQFQHAGVGYAAGGSMGYYWTVDVGNGSGTAPAATPAPTRVPPTATRVLAPTATRVPATPVPVPTSQPPSTSGQVNLGPATDQEASALYRVLSLRFAGRESITAATQPSGTWIKTVQVAAGADSTQLATYASVLRLNVTGQAQLPSAVPWSGTYSVDIYTPSALGPDGWATTLARRYQYGAAAGRVALRSYSGGQYVHVTGLPFNEASMLRTLAGWFGFTAYLRNYP